MSRTVDLVKAFVSRRPPVEMETLQRARYELTDPNDENSTMLRLPDVTVPTLYCWRIDVAGQTYWINQDQGAQLMDALEVEDPGQIVGTLVKVNRDGKTLHYGPVDLSANAWQQIQAGVVLNS